MRANANLSSLRVIVIFFRQVAASMTFLPLSILDPSGPYLKDWEPYIRRPAYWGQVPKTTKSRKNVYMKRTGVGCSIVSPEHNIHMNLWALRRGINLPCLASVGWLNNPTGTGEGCIICMGRERREKRKQKRQQMSQRRSLIRSLPSSLSLSLTGTLILHVFFCAITFTRKRRKGAQSSASGYDEQERKNSRFFSERKTFNRGFCQLRWLKIWTRYVIVSVSSCTIFGFLFHLPFWLISYKVLECFEFSYLSPWEKQIWL